MVTRGTIGARLLACAALAALAPSCSCATDLGTAPDAGDDAGYLVLPDAGTIDQPCASGIRRVPVALPPVLNERAAQDFGGIFHVEGDVVLAAQLDLADGTASLRTSRGMFARVDVFTGEVTSSGYVDLPFPADDLILPLAFRSIEDGTTDVLFAQTSGAAFEAVVARFGADGSAVSVTPVVGTGLPQPIYAATATTDGFALAGLTDLVLVRGADTTSGPHGMSFGPFLPMMQVSMDLAADGRVWLAIAGDTSVGVALFDVTGAPTLVGRADVAITPGPRSAPLGAVALQATPDGALIAASRSDGVEIVWLDEAVHETGRARLDGAAAMMIGAAGALPRQGILLDMGTYQADGVAFALADAPGHPHGGLVPLAAGGDGWIPSIRAGRRLGVRSDGAFTAASWMGALTILTFCEGT
jgi:hypothetical protein